MASASSGEAQAPQISISLSGLEEVAAVTTTANGSFRGNLGANSLDGELIANGTALTQAHIHLGAKGSNGPVVAFLFGLDAVGVNAIHTAVTVTPEKLIGPLASSWPGFVSALRSGGLYVNVHSVSNPAGIVRGQIPGNAPGPPGTGSGTDSSTSFAWMQPLGFALLGLAAGGAVLALSRRRKA